MTTEVKNIDVALIDNPGHDVRVGVNVEELDDLKQSISKNGILQPLLLRPRGERFEVIAGNRRLQVARNLGLDQVPALLRDASDAETAVFRFEENLKRANVNAVEEAKYIAECITQLRISTEEFAEKIGRTSQWIEDRLAIAEMPDYMQGYIVSKQIPLGVALALNQITDERIKRQWSDFAAENGMTVPAAQNALREWQKDERRRQEAGEDEVVPATPATPPVAKADCVRCGTRRPVQQLRFVRICNPVCPTEEEGGGS